MQGRVGLYVEVHDKDQFTDNDLVAILSGSTGVSPALNARSSPRPIPLTLRGKFATLEVEIRAHCHDNYFGSGCTTFCRPQDDDIAGHYTCTEKGTTRHITDNVELHTMAVLK